jgi:hypothetical protein
MDDAASGVDEWCGIKAKDLAEHLHRDPSMISRLHAAYVENRDKRSESELQRWLKTKSNNSSLAPHPLCEQAVKKYS